MLGTYLPMERARIKTASRRPLDATVPLYRNRCLRGRPPCSRTYKCNIGCVCGTLASDTAEIDPRVSAMIHGKIWIVRGAGMEYLLIHKLPLFPPVPLRPTTTTSPTAQYIHLGLYSGAPDRIFFRPTQQSCPRTAGPTRTTSAYSSPSAKKSASRASPGRKSAGSGV